MTQLLLKDLCARLPYETHVYIEFENGNILDDTVLNAQYIHDWMAVPSCQNMAIKPYLRQLSSMTEEEKEEFDFMWDRDFGVALDNQISNCADKSGFENGTKILEIVACNNAIDWLNKNHFDYRGLIEKGIALEAPEGMYKIV